MQTVVTAVALRRYIRRWGQEHKKIALVPTMGKLHAGHLALIERAKVCAERVVCSIFVNPLQFDSEEDLRTYPRTPEQDIRALQKADVDLVFMPEYEEIYGQGVTVSIPENPLRQQLCGTFRPGFFDGVVEVVTRLFHIITPDVVVFGEKDYQQLIIIKQLVRDLELPIQVEQVATQREADGLACSSRNVHLSITERKQASQLYVALTGIKEQIQQGNRRFHYLEKQGMGQLKATGFHPDYVTIRAAENMDIPDLDTEFLVILAAAWLGKTRLVDNVLLRVT